MISTVSILRNMEQHNYERKYISLPPGIIDATERIRRKDETFSGIVADLLKKEISRRRKR